MPLQANGEDDGGKSPEGEKGTEVVVEGGTLKLRTHKIRIEVVSGPNAGTTVELPGDEARIGTGRGCHLVLYDTTVSRHHLTLRGERLGVRVVDSGSRNGTRLDGVRVWDALARADSLIVIGNTTLRLALLDELVELPLSARQSFGALIGTSVAMRRVFTVLERLAQTTDSVLLEGETGTGKELAAEAMHDEGARAGEPFVVFDCSAISPNLVESELFGHLRGAFTGAIADRVGAMEAADGGTLFLDEIGELPLELQPKLLRALEKSEVRRVGSNTPKRVDVRIIAATNRDLFEEVTRGRFREDLYYRVAVVTARMPPLRERPDDIPLLARHFAKGREAALSGETLSSLSRMTFPGNVRELRNAVAQVLSLGGLNQPRTRGASPTPGPIVDLGVPLKEARDAVADAFEEAYLRAVLEQTEGNATRAAEIAGVHRKFVQRALKKYKLRGE